MSLSEANRKYFDAISDSYDAKPWFAKVNQQVTDVVRSRLDWLGIPFANQDGVPSADNAREVRLLDYACGTGLMTRIFGPYVTVTLGMDVSPKMVESYNSRIQSAIANLPNSGTSSNIPHAITADLLNKSDPDPAQLSAAEYYDFDLAAVGFAFHHFEDVVFAAQQLKKRLRPGGVLFINDFLEGGDMLSGEDGEPVPGSEGNHAVHSHGHGHGHSHHHGHNHDHKHGHEHKEHNPKDQLDEPSKDIFSKHSKEMQASIVVPHFTLQGVHDIFSKSGFVDVEVISMKEKVYMEFGGKKLWRTVLFAKGRKPLDEEQMRSEL